MPTYTAPVKDMQFVLHEVLQVTQQDVPGYDELDADFTSAILEEAGKISSEVLQPLNAVGDQEGCVLENGVVRTPKGFKEAFDQMKEGGWTALDCDPDYGGQGLPYLMGTAVGEMMVSANMAFNMYQGLTHGAYSAIHAHGTEAQDRHHEPDGAALRHRSGADAHQGGPARGWPDAHQGGPARGRQLQNLRAEDFHLGGRA